MTTSKSKKYSNKFLRSINLCLVILLVVGGFYFLKSIDDVMTRNLELEQLKSDLQNLQDEKQDLDYKKNVLGSYESIKTRIDDLKMVKVSEIDYINWGEESLAKK